MAVRGLLLVISGPSGAGKGTVLKALLENHDNIQYSISATTRHPRAGEIDGVNYFFLEKERFNEMIAEGAFLEWAQVYDNYYGTPKKPVLDALEKGIDVVLEIDTQGALQVKEIFPEGVYIFILPPSLEELRKRIVNRGTETEEDISKRLGCAMEEIAQAPKYDYIVVNDDIIKASEQIAAIITAEKCRVIRTTALAEFK